MNAHIGSSGNSAAQASDPPDSTEDIIAFFASHVEAIDIALVHIKTIVDERGCIVNIVAFLDIGYEHFCKFGCRRAIRHKAPSETASQQERAALFIELGIARALDINVTVQLEKIHLAVAIEHQRKIHRNIIYRDFVFLIVLAVAGMLFSFTAQFFAAKAAVGCSSDLRQSLFEKIGTFSYAQYDDLTIGTLITRMTADINQIQTGLNLALRLLLRSPFIVFGSLIMAFTIDVRLALIFAVVIPLL